jgi:hypothetical protein
MRSALTATFGFYRFENIPVGETYIISVSRKAREFVLQAIFVTWENYEITLSAHCKFKSKKMRDRIFSTRLSSFSIAAICLYSFKSFFNSFALEGFAKIESLIGLLNSIVS